MPRSGGQFEARLPLFKSSRHILITAYYFFEIFLSCIVAAIAKESRLRFRDRRYQVVNLEPSATEDACGSLERGRQLSHRPLDRGSKLRDPSQ
ncbi:hypothetical protein TNCV_3330001 [Trichonephila clavipes]|nr:hypothetical protein TNCV_3330001 [Trichonephila clavipes]